MYNIPAILRLEDFLTEYMNLLVQEQMSYPPFLFGTGSGSLGHYLFLHQPTKNIYTRFHYTYCQPAARFRFLNLIVRNQRREIAKINSLGRTYDPDRFDCRITQSKSIRDQISINLCWNFGRLESAELINCDYSYGKTTDENKIRHYEESLEVIFPCEIDVPAKVEEIFDLTGYEDFFKELVSKTPCDICRQVQSEHHQETDHGYRPFLIYTKNNTFCQTCGELIEKHSGDHEFKPEFVQYRFSDLLRPFPNIDYPC